MDALFDERDMEKFITEHLKTQEVNSIIQKLFDQAEPYTSFEISPALKKLGYTVVALDALTMWVSKIPIQIPRWQLALYWMGYNSKNPNMVKIVGKARKTWSYWNVD